jgi:hypothetical protein
MVPNASAECTAKQMSVALTSTWQCSSCKPGKGMLGCCLQVAGLLAKQFQSSSLELLAIALAMHLLGAARHHIGKPTAAPPIAT